MSQNDYYKASSATNRGTKLRQLLSVPVAVGMQKPLTLSLAHPDKGVAQNPRAMFDFLGCVGMALKPKSTPCNEKKLKGSISFASCRVREGWNGNFQCSVTNKNEGGGGDFGISVMLSI